MLRHPYDVGDRIAVSDVNSPAPAGGSPGWVVKDIDLFTTTYVSPLPHNFRLSLSYLLLLTFCYCGVAMDTSVLYGTTNEVATYSNGSLANSRIINMARSPKANMHFLFKFPIDTSYA